MPAGRVRRAAGHQLIFNDDDFPIVKFRARILRLSIIIGFTAVSCAENDTGADQQPRAVANGKTGFTAVNETRVTTKRLSPRR